MPLQLFFSSCGAERYKLLLYRPICFVGHYLLFCFLHITFVTNIKHQAALSTAVQHSTAHHTTPQHTTPQHIAPRNITPLIAFQASYTWNGGFAGVACLHPHHRPAPPTLSERLVITRRKAHCAPSQPMSTTSTSASTPEPFCTFNGCSPRHTCTCAQNTQGTCT